MGLNKCSDEKEDTQSHIGSVNYNIVERNVDEEKRETISEDDINLTFENLNISPRKPTQKSLAEKRAEYYGKLKKNIDKDSNFTEDQEDTRPKFIEQTLNEEASKYQMSTEVDFIIQHEVNLFEEAHQKFLNLDKALRKTLELAATDQSLLAKWKELRNFILLILSKKDITEFK